MIKDPTCTSLVLDELVNSDDFKSVRQIMLCTRLSSEHVRFTLAYLRKCKAVGMVSDHDETWWYATPDTDTRSHTMAERIAEVKPRRLKRKKV